MPTTYGPKKPSTSYFMFMAATREKVKAKNPEASTTQLSRVLGEQWRALTPEAKAVFEQKAADDKIRYQKEYERWVVEHPEEVALQNAAKEDKKRGKKRSKEEGAPKRALTAYIYFTNAVRAETKKDAPDAKVTQTHPPTRCATVRVAVRPPACLPGVNHPRLLTLVPLARNRSRN
jgi:hypothetical protein